MDYSKTHSALIYSWLDSFDVKVIDTKKEAIASLIVLENKQVYLA